MMDFLLNNRLFYFFLLFRHLNGLIIAKFASNPKSVWILDLPAFRITFSHFGLLYGITCRCVKVILSKIMVAAHKQESVVGVATGGELSEVVIRDVCLALGR